MRKKKSSCHFWSAIFPQSTIRNMPHEDKKELRMREQHISIKRTLSFLKNSFYLLPWFCFFHNLQDYSTTFLCLVWLWVLTYLLSVCKKYHVININNEFVSYIWCTWPRQHFSPVPSCYFRLLWHCFQLVWSYLTVCTQSLVVMGSISSSATLKSEVP